MRLTKQEFNQQVEQNKIDIRPNNTAYINGVKYKILPVSSTDTHVELEEVKQCDNCEGCSCGEGHKINEKS